MKKPIHFFAFALLCVASLLSTSTFAQHGDGQMNIDLTSAFAESDAAARVAEAYEIAHVVEATHPLGRTLATNPEWAVAIEELAAAAEAGNQAKHLTSVMALLAILNDGHTTVPIGFCPRAGAFSPIVCH